MSYVFICQNHRKLVLPDCKLMIHPIPKFICPTYLWVLNLLYWLATMHSKDDKPRHMISPPPTLIRGFILVCSFSSYLEMFPEIGVPPNHSFLDRIFPNINQPAIGVPPWRAGNPPCGNLWNVESIDRPIDKPQIFFLDNSKNRFSGKKNVSDARKWASKYGSFLKMGVPQ